MHPSTPSSLSPYQDPQQGRWHKVGRTLQTRSLRTRPRRSRAAAPWAPPLWVWSPWLSWSHRGHQRKGIPASWCQTDQSKPRFYFVKTIFKYRQSWTVPWGTWSHHGPVQWLHWSPQSQCHCRDQLCQPWLLCLDDLTDERHDHWLIRLTPPPPPFILCTNVGQ